MLTLACTLVAVGSPNARSMAQILFEFLSPRLGAFSDSSAGHKCHSTSGPLDWAPFGRNLPCKAVPPQL